MRFPNAANGVKKIFTAEILGLIAALCMLISLILMAIFAVTGAAVANSSPDAAAVGVVATGALSIPFMIASGVLAIIGFIINLVGISSASKDEPSFKIALYAVIAGIVFAVLSSVFAANGFISSLMEALGNLASLVVTLYVIQGIRNLALRLNNPEVDRKGQNIFKIILVTIILQLIANMVALIFGGPTASVIAAVIAICAAVLEIVRYVMYLSYLAKAKKMLAE